MSASSLKSFIHSKPLSAHKPPVIFSSAFSTEIPDSALPWKPPGCEYDPGLFGLNAEIRDFVNFISPSIDEKWSREFVIARVRACILSLWPSSRVEVCGSFQTNLYLPTSDIDLVIFGSWDPDRLPLEILKNHLESHNIASNIRVLSRATVPIVKLVDKESEIQVDISFNMDNSIRAVHLIADYLKLHPCLKYLVLVLKQFLHQRDLNEVFTGGLGSYALILMCVSFLQHNVTNPVDVDKINLAVLLIEFLELYGQRFNYNTTAIRLDNGGEYCQKSELFLNPEMLCIQDPLNSTNDLGRRTFAMMQVKQSFEYAYTVLRSAVLPQYQQIHSPSVKSILGRIIRIPVRTLEKRKQLQNYALKVRQQLIQIPYLTTPLLVPALSIPSSAKYNSTNGHKLPGCNGDSVINGQRVSSFTRASTKIDPNQSASKTSSNNLQPVIPPDTTQAIFISPSTASLLSTPTTYASLSLSNPVGIIGTSVNQSLAIIPQFMAQPFSLNGSFPVQLPVHYQNGSYHLVHPQNINSNQLPSPRQLNENREHSALSSCSPESSSKSSTVSSSPEDSSEELVFGPEKRRPPPDTPIQNSNLADNTTVILSAAGDGPETPASRIMFEDAGVKSMVELVNNASQLIKSNNIISESLSRTCVEDRDGLSPEPTVVRVPKSVSRKNRSQAKKFDPNHYRLKGGNFIHDPGVRLVENTINDTLTKNTKQKKTQVTTLRSSSEEADLRMNGARLKQHFNVHENDSHIRTNCSIGSKRKRLQTRKAQLK